MKNILSLPLYLIAICFFILATTQSQAQSKRGGVYLVDSIGYRSANLVRIGAATHLPILDMSDRFGQNAAVGGAILHKTKNNWVYGVEGTYIFGNIVNQDSLAFNLAASNGTIIGIDGEPAEFGFYERGFVLTTTFGKIFNVMGKHPNSGILISLGVGFIQHKIKITDPNNSLPQFQDPYSKGYDRLSNGVALQEFIGYQHLSNNRRINFYVGLEAIQGFNANRRSYTFDISTNELDKKRTDGLLGIKAGWILPLYGDKNTRERYYTR